MGRLETDEYLSFGINNNTKKKTGQGEIWREKIKQIEMYQNYKIL